jgi:hypothetical protein
MNAGERIFVEAIFAGSMTSEVVMQGIPVKWSIAGDTTLVRVTRVPCAYPLSGR